MTTEAKRHNQRVKKRMILRVLALFTLLFFQPAALIANELRLDVANSKISVRIKSSLSEISEFNFTRFSSDIVFDPDHIENATGSLRIDSNSVTAKVPLLADLVKTKPHLDVEQYPEIYFKLTDVNVLDKTNIEIFGDLTLKGKTKNIVFRSVVMANDKKTSPNQAQIAMHGSIKRDDFNFGSRELFFLENIPVSLLLSFVE